MKKIMLSIRPPWCEKILSGEKILEIRKSEPSQEVYPCEVHLYETEADGGKGLVVGKCMLLGAGKLTEYTQQIGEGACLSEEEYAAYSEGKPVFGWVIAEPKRFSRPVSIRSYGFERPPQSWGYIGDCLKPADNKAQEELLPSEQVKPQPDSEIRTIISPDAFYGICKFCGQIKYFQSAEQPRPQRDESVSLSCTCSEGADYRSQQERERRIKREIDRAEILIEEQFGEMAKGTGKLPATPDQLVLLTDLAERVIRCGIKSASIELTEGVRAKVSRTSKNVTVITRTDTDSTKAEV